MFPSSSPSKEYPVLSRLASAGPAGDLPPE
jgi:hypothetical protein